MRDVAPARLGPMLYADGVPFADWKIGSGSIPPVTFSAAECELQSVAYEIDAARHTGYWVWKVMFPLFLIVGMS